MLYFIAILLIKGGILVKTYLITGGAGFIGSTLTEKLLIEGNKVVVIDNFNNYYDPKLKQKNIESFLDNNNYTLYKVDIRNRSEVAKVFDSHKIDVVVHLAAMAGVRPSIEDPILYQEVNGVGTQNILEESKLHKVKNLVLASSSSVYGNCMEVPFKEDMIEIIGRELKVKPNIEQLPMQQGDVDRTYADISKAEKLLGYKPKVAFEDGIKVFIAWYLKNREEEK